MCECVYDVFVMCLLSFFLKDRPKKQMKSFSFFFLLFSLMKFLFLSLLTERVKINHRKKNRDSKKKKKKKTKTKTILIRYNKNKNESDGVIGVEMARAKYGPDMFRQSGRRGRIRLFPTSLGAGDAHVYIENDSRENATRTETIGRTGSIFSARD